MHFTLVVATRNRPLLLQRLLSSVAAQSHRDIHVIVVDQSDDDRAKQNSRLITTTAPDLSMHYIRAHTRGLSKARNEGLSSLDDTTDVVAFPDDDCWYPPDLLHRVATRFSAADIPPIVLGQFAPPDAGRHPDYPQKPFVLTAARAFGASVGLFFPAALFLAEEVRFDERIGAGTPWPAAEEFDVLLAGLAAGYRAEYDPDILVYHAIDEGEDCSDAVWAEEVARSYVMGKHWRRHNGAFVARIIGRCLRAGVLTPVNSIARIRFKGMMQGYLMAMGRPPTRRV